MTDSRKDLMDWLINLKLNDEDLLFVIELISKSVDSLLEAAK